MNLEYYSNLAFVASVVVYALAMLAHAAEWATARKVDADVSAEEVREPALAAVGVGDSAADQAPPTENRRTSSNEMPRRSRFCGEIVNHSGWWPDYVTRLWRRGHGRFADVAVHERVIVEGRTGRLTQPIEHDAIADLDDARAKAARYAKAAAGELAAQGKRSSTMKAALRSAGAFLRTFVWRAGFLDGATGWRVARYNADYTFRKWAGVMDAGATQNRK